MVHTGCYCGLNLCREPADWGTLCVRLVPTWETLFTETWLCFALCLYKRHHLDMLWGQTEVCLFIGMIVLLLGGGGGHTNKASKHLIFKELHEMKGSADCEKSTVVTQVFKGIS